MVDDLLQRSKDPCKKALADAGVTADQVDEVVARFGQGFGAEAATVGEICFNTSLSGYQEVITPQVLDVAMWKTSGHYDNFRESMFFTEAEEREFYERRAPDYPEYDRPGRASSGRGDTNSSPSIATRAMSSRWQSS